MSFHKNLLGDDLHGIKPKAYNGNPLGNLTPEYIGEVIVNTDTNAFYRAEGITSSDWTIVGGAGDISQFSQLSDVSIADRVDQTLIRWNETAGVYEHILENPSLTSIYVDSLTGSNTEGDGTAREPYRTVEFALSQITDSSITKRYEIVLAPGIYSENNPLPLKDYVVIMGHSSFVSRIDAQNTSLPMFEAATPVNSEIQDITVYNAGEVANIQNDSMLVFNHVVPIDCGAGYTFNASADYALNILGGMASTPTRTMTHFVNCDSGRVVIRDFTFINGISATDLINTNGPDAFVVMNGMTCISSNVGDGIDASNNSRILFDGLLLEDMDVAIRADTGALIEGFSFSLRGTTYDVYQADDAEFRLSGGSLSNERKFYLENAERFRSHISYQEDEGIVGTHNTRDFTVGLPEKGRSSVFGEGDETSRGTLVYSFNGVSFTDVTTEATSPSGSTFSFPTTANSGFYVTWNLEDSTTSTHKLFLGLQINFATAMAATAGQYDLELWNGTSWVSAGYMVTEGQSPYLPQARNLHGLLGINQVRLSCLSPTFWEKNDPIGSGTNRYWLRFRLLEAIETAPTIEQIKLHSNHSKVNDDGWLEYYGKARPLGVLPWNMGLLNGAADTPSSSDVYLSNNLQVGMTENSFASNSTNIMGFVSVLPFDVDTSCPIRFRFTWFGDSNTAGNVVWRINMSYTTAGDLIYTAVINAPATHSREVSNTITVSVGANQARQQRSSVVEVDISKLVSRRAGGYGDQLWISLARLGGDVADTYPGSAVLFSITPVHTRWCEGSHEESALIT